MKKPGKKIWISNFTNLTSLKISGCHDYEPNDDKIYFSLNKEREIDSYVVPTFHHDKRNLPIIVIGICFYNENAMELRRTLVSLADQVKSLENKAICQVVFVSDGHQQMSNDAKEYFRHIFCKTSDESENWDQLMGSMEEYCNELNEFRQIEKQQISDTQNKPPDHLTYIIQKIHAVNNESGQTELQRGNVTIKGSKDLHDRQLPLSLILKASNRRKHNSQEWILKAFATQSVMLKNKIDDKNYSNRFVFLSDCGTLFDKNCILKIFTYMNSHPKCVGATGRQRVMTAKEQDLDEEKLISVQKFFRLVQQADYEASYAVYTGAFAAAGCLPVLPGPCAMFRLSSFYQSRKFRSLDPLEILLAQDIVTPIDNRESNDSSSFSELAQLSKRYSNIVDLDRNVIEREYEVVEIEDFGDQTSYNTDSSTTVEFMELTGLTKTRETALEHFSRIVATPPEKTDLVLENVKLAEDRIPSYAIVTHCEPGSYTTWVDGATFKFQAETQLKNWVAQRRRWINGAFLCYVWSTLTCPELILGSRHNIFRKLLIYFLFATQLINYILASLSPAIFSAALHLAVLSLFQAEQHVALVITGIYCALTLLFMWVHRYITFVKPLFYLMALINAAFMCIILAAFFEESIRWSFSPPSLIQQILQWATIGIIGVPFFMAIVSLDLKSLGLLLVSCIPYWLFLPTLIGSFTIYAFSRLSDTTWGNRVSEDGAGFKDISRNQIINLQNDLSSNASVALLFLSIANVGLLSFLVAFHKNSLFILICMAIVLAPMGIQVLISTIYFIVKHLSCNTCRPRRSL